MQIKPRALVLLIVLFALPSFSILAQAPISFERDRGRMMLNVIKVDLKKNYYDPNFHGIDVDARFKQADEKIKTATSIGQIFGIIAQTLVDFDDSHLYFLPPGRSYRTEYGWQMQMIGEKCYVVAVKPGSDAEAKGLKEGDEIYTIDGIGPVRENLWKILYTYHSLRPKAGVRFEIIKPNGQQVQMDVMAKVDEGKRVMDLTTSRDLYDLIRRAENEDRLHRHRYIEMDELLIWQMPGFDLSDPKVDEMFSKAKKRKTLILDLRGNGGGLISTLERMVGNLFDRDITIGNIKRRKEAKPLTAKTRGSEAFSGKLIVLIDSRSGSSAELLARVVQLEKRGVVIGDVSAGAVMISKTHPYELGIDTIIMYAASITDADVLMGDGKSLEKVGVIPDELRLPTAAELAAKLDPVLAYAASLAGVTISPEKARAMFPVEWRK